MLENLEEYSNDFLKILTKQNELIPLKLNGYQQKVNKVIQDLRRDNKPVRIIVLKARQIGISTFCTAAIYHPAATNFYTRSEVVADDVENTTNLFNMCKTYYQFSDEQIKPMKRYSNEKALVFENPNEKLREENPGLLSSIKLQSSNKLTAGRSGTINHLHLSEVAYWPNAGTTITGLLQSVPLIPNSSIYIESTANGIAGKGEEFYIRWQQAESGESDFVPLFFPWFDNPEYELEIEDGFKLDAEEIEIKDMYKLTDEKMAWRRYKIRNDMGNALMRPEEQFCQEYPCSPIEAFISSGRSVFDNARILKLINELNAVKYETMEI